MSFQDLHIFYTPSGAALALRSAVPPDPRAVVQINHGLSEHSARYAWFAESLTQAGYAAYTHDHRGHGVTKAPDAPLGRFADRGGGRKVVDDAAFVLDTIAARHPGLPVIAFGHSMGGVIALNLAMRYPQKMQGVAIWNSTTQGGINAHAAKLILAWEKFRLGSDVPSRLLPKLTFQAWAKEIPNNRTHFDWLSRDHTEVEKYIADPLCGRDPSVSLWIDLFDLIFATADDRNLAPIPRTMPFHLVGGEKDPATHGGKDVETLRQRLAANGFSNLQSRIYEATRHESLKELNREAVVADFIAWLARIT